MIIKKEPQKSNIATKDKTCENCAWTFGCSNRAKESKYYCYDYDRYFEWERELKKEKDFVYYLKMTPCSSFHEIPFDMKRGAEFAKYFQNKWQIEESSKRSWISIFIAGMAVIVSAIALFMKIK